MEPPPGGWVGRRLREHSSSTLCELYALLDTVNLVCQREVNAAIICDSKPAIQSLSAVQPTHPQVVQQILSFLSLMNARKVCVKFVWVTSHVGLCHNATADRLAKEACRLPPRGDERLSPCPAISPESAPPPFFLHGVVGTQRGLTASPSTITSPFAATNTSTDAEASWFGNIMLFPLVCGWATVHRGRSPGWKGSLYLRNVACAAQQSPTPSNSTAWPATPFVVCYPKGSRWMLSAAASCTTTSSMSSWCATVVLEDYHNVMCPARHLYLSSLN